MLYNLKKIKEEKEDYDSKTNVFSIKLAETTFFL
jgi:hypothetical protein